MKKRAREENRVDAPMKIQMPQLPLDVWEKIVRFGTIDAYAKLTHTCKWLWRLWAEISVRRRILKHFTVYRMDLSWSDIPDCDFKGNVRLVYAALVNGRPHCDDGFHAIETEHGDKLWYQNGLEHRDNDEPAIEWSDGTKEWSQFGKLHRENDLPAIERAKSSRWYWQGQLHRANGKPAYETASGYREWWVKGKRVK